MSNLIRKFGFFTCWGVLIFCAFANYSRAQDSVPDKTKEDPKVDKVTEQDGLSGKMGISNEGDKLYWAFLVTGKSNKGVPREEIDRMQEAHLANFKRLADEGKLLTAGPMNDPDGVKRGIVVLRAGSDKDIPAMFESDPYVKKGFLKIQASKMKFELGQIRTRITPQGLDEYRIVVLESKGSTPKPLTDDVADETLKYLKAKYSSAELNLSLKLFDESQSCRQVLIFKNPDDEKSIAKTVSEIPAVKHGLWQGKVMPLFMGKGSIDRIDD